MDRPFVATLAHRILILHAAQGSKTEALCQQALAAQPLPPDDPSALLTA